MIPKIILALFILIIGLFGMQRLWLNYNQKEKVKLGRVVLAIEDTKSKGKRDVQLPAPIPLYASVSNLDEALANYSTVIMRPVRRVSQIGPNSKEIETWYKLEIVEYLSQPNRVSACLSCISATGIPTELRSIGENELLVVQNVGSVVSDGITVTSTDLMFPEFKFEHEYLLFVSIDPNTRIGEIELGPAGVSVIDAGGELKPISEKSHKLNDELTARFGKIQNVKQELKFRRFPPQ
jgi:hypothetical protein